MKTRIGFVSNSSGTSFVIFGVVCEKKKWLEKVIKYCDNEKIEKVADDYLENEINFRNEKKIKNLKTLKEKIEYIFEDPDDFSYEIAEIFENELGFYIYDGGDPVFWFGTRVDTYYDRYCIEHILKQIQLGKEIAKKYGFREDEVEMYSVFNRT